MARSPAFGYLTRQPQRTAATKRLYGIRRSQTSIREDEYILKVAYSPGSKRFCQGGALDDLEDTTMKALLTSALAFSLCALAGAADAGSTRQLHPWSFDYYDQNGIEHTGIDLNLYGATPRQSRRELQWRRIGPDLTSEA